MTSRKLFQQVRSVKRYSVALMIYVALLYGETSLSTIRLHVSDLRMSFELFVQFYRSGESAMIPREKLRQVFGDYLAEVDPNFWELRFDPINSCELYLTAHPTDPSLIEGFTVGRPCADQRIWDSMVSVLGLGNAVLYFPGCKAPLVKDT